MLEALPINPITGPPVNLQVVSHYVFDEPCPIGENGQAESNRVPVDPAATEPLQKTNTKATTTTPVRTATPGGGIKPPVINPPVINPPVVNPPVVNPILRPAVNSTFQATTRRENLLEIPQYIRDGPQGPSTLETKNTLKIGYLFDCCPGDILCVKDQIVWNGVLAGAVEASFWKTSGLFDGPVHQAYCRFDTWPDNTDACLAKDEMRAWFNSADGDAWRTANEVDIGMWINELIGWQGCASLVHQFFEPDWTSAGADRTRAFATDDPDVAISKYSIQHEIGHLSGFRHNRAQDEDEFLQQNHGGAWLSGSSDDCWPSIMSYNNACDGTGKVLQARYGSYASNFHFPARNRDWHKKEGVETYHSGCNAWIFHHMSLQHIAAYV